MTFNEQLAHRNAMKERDARLAAADERIAQLQRHSSIGPGTATAVAGAVNGQDDFGLIRGFTPQDEIALNEAG